MKKKIRTFSIAFLASALAAVSAFAMTSYGYYGISNAFTCGIRAWAFEESGYHGAAAAIEEETFY
ncbi:MAG: hypothetical protein HUJ76_01450 [Parasporobacterium sp.]|nr:hypothetical protein [Parasporobacterium sp.]